MKILIAIDTYETNNNGTSISAQRYSDVLRQHGHEVRILSVDSEHYRLAERHIYPFNGLIHKHGFRFANSLSRHSQEVIREAVSWCDMVHCMMPFVLSNRVKKMADELCKPATAAFHIQPENLTSSAGLGKVSWITNATYALFYHLVYKHFRHVHTPSQFMADELRKRGYSMHLHPISNGIDPSFCYHKSKVKSRKSEAGLGLVENQKSKEGKFTIVMTGRLSREKRQDLLLKAVLQSKYADRIQVIFAGKGPLMSYYQRLGERLPRKPIFGYYSRTELQHLLSQTDLYVHASDMESEAIGCIEAFAMGLVPIISDSRLSATRQFALSERSLFKAGSPESLAERIDYWLDHESERQEMEIRYAEHARQYHLEGCVCQFEAMLARELWEQNHLNANTSINLQQESLCQEKIEPLSSSALLQY